MASFSYKIIKEDKKTKARAGKLITLHGIVKTPCFTPVGTQATVKALSAEESFRQSVQSYLGYLTHANSFKIKRQLKDKFSFLSRVALW